MKIKIATIAFFCFVLHSFCAAQNKYGQQWVSGTFGGVTSFNNNVGQPSFRNLYGINKQHFFVFAPSNICDSATGSILFACNSSTIYDTLGNIMQGGGCFHATQEMNGGGSGGSSSSCNGSYYYQSSIVIPKSNNQYYVFMPSFSQQIVNDYYNGVSWPRSDILYAQIVDMKLNGGLGAVAVRNKVIDTNTYLRTTGMTACRHANGKDWWLIKQGFGKYLKLDTTNIDDHPLGWDSTIVYTYLVKQDTVEGPFIQNLPFNGNYEGVAGRGQISVSQDGSKIVFAHNYAMFFGDFDRCTGLVHNAKPLLVPIDSSLQMPNDTTIYYRPYYSVIEGVNFSNNNRFVYMSNGQQVWQYQIAEPDSAKAWCKVIKGPRDSLNKGGQFSNIGFAPDGRLYISSNGAGPNVKWSIINFPDLKDSACGPCTECYAPVSFHNADVISNAPNMPNYNLGALPASACWPAAVKEPIKSKGFSISQNPSHGECSIRFNVPLLKPSTISIYNMQGALLGAYIVGQGASQLNVPLPKAVGVYVVKVGDWVERVVVE
jgi:hypothetical protein